MCCNSLGRVGHVDMYVCTYVCSKMLYKWPLIEQSTHCMSIVVSVLREAEPHLTLGDIACDSIHYSILFKYAYKNRRYQSLISTQSGVDSSCFLKTHFLCHHATSCHTAQVREWLNFFRDLSFMGSCNVLFFVCLNFCLSCSDNHLLRTYVCTYMGC